MENTTEVAQRTENEIQYDPAIPLEGTYSCKMKTLIWKDTHTLMFITALFTIAKIWKQSKCPSTDKWVKNCGIYNR